jgi:hypothetical protein
MVVTQVCKALYVVISKVVNIFVDMVMDAELESVTASAEHQREEELQVMPGVK